MFSPILLLYSVFRRIPNGAASFLNDNREYKMSKHRIDMAVLGIMELEVS